MASYRYGIAIVDTNGFPIFYIADVDHDRFGNYYPVITNKIEYCKVFSNAKICKDICENVVGIIPEYKAEYFRI